MIKDVKAFNFYKFFLKVKNYIQDSIIEKVERFEPLTEDEKKNQGELCCVFNPNGLLEGHRNYLHGYNFNTEELQLPL